MQLSLARRSQPFPCRVGFHQHACFCWGIKVGVILVQLLQPHLVDWIVRVSSILANEQLVRNESTSIPSSILQGHNLCQKVFQIAGYENNFSFKALRQKILDYTSVSLTRPILPRCVRVDDCL